MYIRGGLVWQGYDCGLLEAELSTGKRGMFAIQGHDRLET